LIVRSVTFTLPDARLRRDLVALGVIGALLAHGAPVRAEDVPVPIDLQAELLVKVAGYDRSMPDRAGDKVRVLVVSKRGDAESERAATTMAKALREFEKIAGLPTEVTADAFSSAEALAKAVRDQKLAIVYLGPGLGASIGPIAAALDGVSVLTAAAVPGHVPRGAAGQDPLARGRQVAES
jgi:hypothetical protein